MYRKFLMLAPFALFTLVGPLTAGAAGLFVIANPNAGVNAGEIKDIYLGEKQFSGSLKLVPVDNAAAKDGFLKQALAMEPDKYNTAWTKKGFRDGVNPPAVKGSDIEVIEFVKRTPGAVGYVATTPPAGVTVVKQY